MQVKNKIVYHSIYWVKELNYRIPVLLINREWGHYREISDQGLDVLTSLSLGQYIKAEVWDFPVMTERTRLISYLLYGLFSAILKKNTIKTLEATFHIRLCTLGFSSSLIRKKYLYASFFFQLLKVYFVHLFCCFRPHARSFTQNSKKLLSRERIS